MMMKKDKNPLVSVCIPSYNNADYIAETIQCILNQSLTDLELVICDDHSSDKTVDVINTFKDERIRLFINEMNVWKNAVGNI